MFYSKESGLEGKKEIVVLERNYASIKWDKRELIMSCQPLGMGHFMTLIS